MMNRIYSYAILLLFSAIAMGCMKDEETEEEKRAKQEDAQIRSYLTSNGITDFQKGTFGLYMVPISTTTTGALPQENDVVLIDYEMQTLGGVPIGSSQSGPVKIKNSVGTTLPYSLSLVIGFMREGDVVDFIFPSEAVIPSEFEAFEGYNFRDQVGVGKVIVVRVEVLDILTNAQQLEEEKGIISAYVDENNLDAQIRSSGLHYIKLQEGTGAVPANGAICTVHYTLKLLDGTLVQTTIGSSTGPFKFTLGASNIFPGWTEGIGLMKKSEKALFIMPSYLTSYLVVIPEEMRQDMESKKLVGSLPPFEPVLFEVELVNIQ